jgi:hypothetical protein
MGARFYEQLEKRPEALKKHQSIQALGFPAMFMSPQRMEPLVGNRLKISSNQSSASSVRRGNRAM